MELEKTTVIGRDEILEADEILKKYKDGKASIDAKVTENQEWWRQRHWEQIKKGETTIRDETKPVSAWMFNSIINKHADIMDNYPKPNILPRKQEDTDYASALTDIIPVTLTRCHYKQVYSKAGYDIQIEGGRATGVFWDQTLDNGMGGNVIKNCDVHNLFWEPGVEDIQESANFFNVTLMDVDDMKVMYPEHADELKPLDSGTVAKYIHDDNIDTTNNCEVVDWYYKKVVLVEGIKDEMGRSLYTTPKTVLHYVKYCGDVVLYASEDDETCKEGYYRHGLYPFVIKPLFPVKDSVWGFGYVDVMKSPQKYIDVLDEAILKNAMRKTTPRYFIKKSAEINMDTFADWSQLLIPVASGDLQDVLKQVDVDSIPNAVMAYQQNKIDELKETSGNRDFSQGSTSAGVTAASAIASLQEAGSKLARDLNAILYDAHQEEVYMMVENLRQFADQPQSYRVDNGNGGFDFITLDTSLIQDSVFDVEIVAEKQSPFSRAAQNETAKEMYSMGMFAPENALATLACLDMMQFEGIEEVKQNVMENSEIIQQFQQMQAIILEADQYLPGLAMQAGLVNQQEVAMAAEQERGMLGKNGMTANERAARVNTDTTLMAKARLNAANQASIG